MVASSETRELYEGLAVQVTPASIRRRFLAYAIDLGVVYTVISFGVLILFILIIIPGILLGMSGLPGLSIYLIVGLIALLLAVLVFYHGYFIHYERRTGITPGKKICGLQVISLDGGALTLGQALLRDLLRYIDAWLVFPGLLSMSASSQRRRLGDLAAGTIVIENSEVGTTVRYLFIGAEDYRRLLENLAPAAMPEDLCREYLRFAFQTLIAHRHVATINEAESWNTRLLQYLPPERRQLLDKWGYLLFFGEHALQLLSSNVPKYKVISPASGKLPLPKARTYQPGGVRRRLAAILIDGSIISIFHMPFSLLELALNVISPNNWLWVKFAVWPVYICITLGYFVIFYRTRGATPGKMLFGLKVVDSKSGEFLRPSQTIWRETIGKFCSIIVVGLGYFWALFRSDRRTWHDFIGRSQVLRTTSTIAT